MNKRAEMMINNAEKLGVPPVVRPSDITSGNVKLNTVFVAEVFNTKHGLEDLTKEELEEYEKAGIDNDDIEGSRDERAFRYWINSLNIDDVFVTDMYEEVTDGILLLKVIEKLDSKLVEWKRVDKKPNNTFKQGINCSYAVECCKKLGLKIPGIGGSDFVEKNKKNIIAVVWQLVRLHYLKIVGN